MSQLLATLEGRKSFKVSKNSQILPLLSEQDVQSKHEGYKELNFAGKREGINKQRKLFSFLLITDCATKIHSRKKIYNATEHFNDLNKST